MELISRKMGNIIARKSIPTSVCFVLARTPAFTGFGDVHASHDCRDHVTSALWEAITTVLPEMCDLLWLVVAAYYTYHEWYSMLQALSPTSMPDMPWSSTRIVHAFTDGTCCHPCYPDLRYAAYSVVLADPTQTHSACIH